MTPSLEPVTALFFSGIHMDMAGVLNAPALLGASNPGNFTSMPGGASLNTASIGSLLGLECAIIGLTGDDAGGEILKQTLSRRAIKNLLTIRKGKATGTYTSIIEPDGNLLIALADLDLNEDMSARWLLETHQTAMADAQIWFLNANLSKDALLTLSDKNAKLRPNLLAAASISPSKSKNLRASLANLDVLFTNITEANALLNEATPIDAGACIARLQNLGIGKGSLSQGQQLLWVWDKSGVHKFSPPACNKVVDVTGAGDALAGVFLTGLAQGKSMIDTAPLAISAAQMTIGVKGPYNEQINWQELKSRAANIEPLS